ncbi:MAG TPA: VWA domain-containing protein, partial [Kofleriaceae bacterium]
IDVMIRYVAAAQIRHGSLQLVLPAREDSKTPSCHGTLRATLGPGATLAKFTVDGRDATLDAAHRPQFDVDTNDTRIAAELSFAGTQPLVWTQSQPLRTGQATLVTVIAPPLRQQTSTRRTLFVIDGSRSMDLVGKERVRKILHAVASALPAQSSVDAIIYDRTATRVNGDFGAMSAGRLDTIENAIVNHVPSNGSNLAGALALAHTALDNSRDPSLVVVISDGVIGTSDGQTLVDALALPEANVDVLSVIVDPARTTSPGAAVMHTSVTLLGGSEVEVSTDGLDLALAEIDSWLRPSYTAVELRNIPNDVPTTLLSGTGFTTAFVHTTPAAISLEAHMSTQAKPINVTARGLPSAPVGALALAPRDILDKKAPYLSELQAFAVLGDGGELSKKRASLIASGLTYERIITTYDSVMPKARTTASVAQPTPSAIDEMSVRLLLRQQFAQKAYACYERALGKNNTLAGTMNFTFTMGRGEISTVEMDGIADADFQTCLADAAYAMSIPFPDFSVNADDQTVAHYPIVFHLADHKAVASAGDADSSSPIDIDAIKGGVPDSAKRKPLTLTNKDVNTPLGSIRPTR